MFTKSFELSIQVLKKLGRSALLVVLFPILSFAQDLTIAQFREQQAQQKKQAYEKFRDDWTAFLKRQTAQAPRAITPAYARQATEDFLSQTGGFKKIFAEASRNNSFGFTFKRPEDDPLRQASYHRTYHSIFIDIESVPANRWLIRFVHEVAHSLDSELYQSIDIYGNMKLTKELAELGQKNISLGELSVEKRKELEQWLMAGLNRGFLGEYRAWLATLIVYEEGLKDGTFTEMDWLEQIRRSKPADVSLRDHLLRFLSPAWTDPCDGIFQYPFIQQALKELREKIYANPKIVELGRLGEIFKEALK